MSVIPLLPLFHKFNRLFFDGSLVTDNIPIVNIRWSDNRLKTTAGFYKRGPRVLGEQGCEIVLSKPVLQNLPHKAIESTLCHEMIHAWIDLVLKVQEAHGANFHARMNVINASQNAFQITVRHNFPLPNKPPKWLASCPICGLSVSYKRLVRGAACKRCCDSLYAGKWNSNCLLTYEPLLKEY